MTWLRFGKVGLNQYLSRIRISPTDLCTQCNSGEIEDVEHFLLSCRAYDIPRQRLTNSLRILGVNQVSLKSLLGGALLNIDTKLKITHALEIFLRATGRLKDL